MNRNDRDNAHWERFSPGSRLRGQPRAPAHGPSERPRSHRRADARRGTAPGFQRLSVAHQGNADKPQEAILQLGFSDGIYGRSKGGKTFSGWTCEHLPYFVELDNYGVADIRASRMPKGTSLGMGLRRNHLVWPSDQRISRQLARLRLGLGAETDLTEPRNAGRAHGEFTGNALVFRQQPQCVGADRVGDEEAIRAVWAADEANPPRN